MGLLTSRSIGLTPILPPTGSWVCMRQELNFYNVTLPKFNIYWAYEEYTFAKKGKKIKRYLNDILWEIQTDSSEVVRVVADSEARLLSQDSVDRLLENKEIVEVNISEPEPSIKETLPKILPEVQDLIDSLLIDGLSREEALQELFAHGGISEDLKHSLSIKKPGIYYKYVGVS